VRWTAGFDEDEEGIVRSGVAGFARRERAAKRGGGLVASLLKQRREKGEGLGGGVLPLEKMGLGPGRRGFVGVGREVADTGLGVSKPSGSAPLLSQ
jgi:hypothetical protein